MLNIGRVLVDGAILSLLASLMIVAAMAISPRLYLQDYPQDIQDRVPPKTKREKQLSLVAGLPFLLLLVAGPFWSTWRLQAATPATISFLGLWLHAFAVLLIFNLVDLLLLDWLLFCTITPGWMVIPGTAGMAGYKDYGMHFRGFLIGTTLCTVAGALIAAGVWFLG